MNNDRIEALGQSVYIARHGQKNDVTGTDLSDFIDQTVEWANQLTPEIESATDWNFMRTNDSSLGTVTNANSITYSLPDDVKKVVVNAMRDLTIRQDGTVVSSFKMVNANQITDPTDTWDIRDRATTIGRNIVLSRPLRDTEIGGTVTADIIGAIPALSTTDVSLLDILDTYPDIRQLYVLGILKNQILPDIVQGGLTPSFSQKFDDLLQRLVNDNNASADAYDQDHENFSSITGVW